MRSVTRCPASGEPTPTCWSPRLTRPVALTVRSTSITAPSPAGSGDGPAGRARGGRRASSVAPSRDGSVLIRAPSSSTCRLIASAQRVTCRPDRAGPSQTCWPPIHKFPDGGTTRSTSTAGWPLMKLWRLAVALPPRAGSVLAPHQRRAGRVRLAGARRELGRDAQLQRRGCGREPAGGEGHAQRLVRAVGVVFGRQASSAACSASMLSNGPWTSSSSRCKVWCSRSIFPVVVGEWIFVSRWVMPFSRQILSNSTSTGTPGLVEPAGEYLAVVGQDFLGHPVDAHRVHERQAYRPGSSPHHRLGDDAEPGMVIDPGHDLHLGAAGEKRAGGHVQLPQLHRRCRVPSGGSPYAAAPSDFGSTSPLRTSVR